MGLLPNAAKNIVLDALTAVFDTASLHTAFPGTTGANEITGGAYARQANTWNAAAGGSADNSNQPAFSVPGGNTVRWVGFWDNSTSPETFRGCAPNFQAGDIGPLKYTVDVAGDTIQADAHGLVETDSVVFYGGTPPGGLTEGTVYIVMNTATDTFQVSNDTSPLVAITLTTDGGTNVVVQQIREETFASDGTFTLNDADVDLEFAGE